MNMHSTEQMGREVNQRRFKTPINVILPDGSTRKAVGNIARRNTPDRVPMSTTPHDYRALGSIHSDEWWSYLRNAAADNVTLRNKEVA